MQVPGQNGDKPRWQKSKRRHQNGDNPKRRQYNGNITKTAREKCGQNGDKELSIWYMPSSCVCLCVLSVWSVTLRY